MMDFCRKCKRTIYPPGSFIHPNYEHCTCDEPDAVEVTIHFSVENHTTMLTKEQRDLMNFNFSKPKTEVPPTIYDAFTDSELSL